MVGFDTRQLMKAAGDLKPSDLWYLRRKNPGKLMPLQKCGTSWLWPYSALETVIQLRAGLSKAGRPRNVGAATERGK